MELELFTAYYGLDWLASLSGLLGLYLITEKKPVGFLITAASVIVAAGVSLWADQYGFLVSNIVTFALALRGYLSWKREVVVRSSSY
jgi:nicotinamide riboside transporter PnuC